jgi:hypothetical protein
VFHVKHLGSTEALEHCHAGLGMARRAVAERAGETRPPLPSSHIGQNRSVTESIGAAAATQGRVTWPALFHVKQRARSSIRMRVRLNQQEILDRRSLRFGDEATVVDKRRGSQSQGGGKARGCILCQWQRPRTRGCRGDAALHPPGPAAMAESR